MMHNERVSRHERSEDEDPNQAEKTYTWRQGREGVCGIDERHGGTDGLIQAVEERLIHPRRKRRVWRRGV